MPRLALVVQQWYPDTPIPIQSRNVVVQEMSRRMQVYEMINNPQGCDANWCCICFLHFTYNHTNQVVKLVCPLRKEIVVARENERAPTKTIPKRLTLISLSVQHYNSFSASQKLVIHSHEVSKRNSALRSKLTSTGGRYCSYLLPKPHNWRVRNRSKFWPKREVAL